MKDISILLIDDNVKDIETFIDTFKDENISILAAVNFKKAKAILEYIIPDMIVSELTIENDSGYDVLEYIEKQSPFSETSFIFLSKKNDIKQKAKALSCGAEDYFTKPFSAEELKIRVKRIINKISTKRFDIDKKIFSSTANLSILEIIQLLEKTQKNGVLTVFSDHLAGTFHFKNGNIIRGKFGASSGKEAVYKILEIKNATYEFEFKDEECEVEISESTQGVILDGLKLIDEAKLEKKTEQHLSNKIEALCVGFKREQVAHLFDDATYIILTYKNPKDALNILLNVLPDIIIVNPEAPEMDGITFLKALEGNSITYQLPVVFLTSESNEEKKIAALKEGVDDYILPPITKYEFDMKVKRIIKENIMRKNEYLTVLRGSLINFSVIELIQGIQGIEKTCMITFYNGDDNCILFFTDGHLSNAKIHHSEGEEAVYKIMMWSRGYFDIKFKDYPIPKVLKKSTFNLVLDGISKSSEKEEEEIDKIIKTASKKEILPSLEGKINIGLYNFILETEKLEVSDEFAFSTIKIGGLSPFLFFKKAILFIDLNMVEKESLEELISQSKTIYEQIQKGLSVICLTSRPEIYNVQGVLNKFAWLPDYDDTKKIKESLSDQIVIKEDCDFPAFKEITDKMYYTAAFPHGFGSPTYKAILFSDDEIPIGFYKKMGDGIIFLLPQPQSKENLINFFTKKIFTGTFVK